jgi:glycosyltransferase involved in cell wall biosynthesis
LKPVTSIIIPTLNYANYLPKAVASIFETTEISYSTEVIIVDDGSTDDTKEVVAFLSKQYPIIYIIQPPSGKSVATKKGIEIAKGEYIFTLDADDWFLPNKIESTVSIFRKYPKVVHVASPASIRWEDGSRDDEMEVLPAWLTGKPLTGLDVLRRFMEKKMLFGGGSTFAARASVLKELSLPPEVDMYTDEWLVIQVLLAGDTYFLPDPLSVWRIHQSNYSVQQHSAAGLAAKHARLKASSLAILQNLQDAEYPRWLQRVYALKHETRKMVWQEQEGSKKLKDRLHYLFHCMFTGAYPLGWWASYRVINRLIK